VTEDLWGAARTALERVPAQPPGVKALTRRTRSLRARRVAVAALALLLVGAGVFFPLRLLSRFGERPEPRRIGPGASSNAQAEVEGSHSYRPDWFAHLDSEDKVRVEAPRDWVFRKDPTILGEPKILFGLGSWDVPGYWEGEACGYDSILRFLPETAVLIWLEEIRFSASLSKDFVRLEAPPGVGDLFPRDSGCVPQQPVEGLGFHLDDRDFLVSVAFGARSPGVMRATVDQVLRTFRTRIEEEPFPPEPAGRTVEVGSGTAFGRIWTLSVYRPKGGAYAGNVCYWIVGGLGTGCADPDAVKPSTGELLTGITVSGERGPNGQRAFAHGIVGKDVAGITLTLDDGRVFSISTLKSKVFPVAFYVVPFEGKGEQVIVIEALDAKGKVLQEMNLLEQRSVAEERVRG
jgi:hypothetical protein